MRDKDERKEVRYCGTKVDFELDYRSVVTNPRWCVVLYRNSIIFFNGSVQYVNLCTILCTIVNCSTERIWNSLPEPVS